MHISKEFLLEAFGLSLLVALIWISSNLFHKATELTERLEIKQEKTMTDFMEYEITRYDGRNVDGMTVIGYIKTAIGEYRLPVNVRTEKGNFVISEKEKCSELREFESEYYINPMALYRCKVKRDENGSFSEIEICVVKEGD